MYALHIVLNEIDKMDEIHKILYNNECGATTFDSIGMGKVLLDNNVDIPVFAGLRKLIEGNKPYNKTIVSVIRNEQKLRVVIDEVKVLLGMDKQIVQGIGFIYVMPVLECHGFNLEEEK